MPEPKTFTVTSAGAVGEARSNTGTALNTSGSVTGPPGSGTAVGSAGSAGFGLRFPTSFARPVHSAGAFVHMSCAHVRRSSPAGMAVTAPVSPPVRSRAWATNRIRTVTVIASGVPPRLRSSLAPEASP